MHARIHIYWCRSCIFRHLKLELLTQFPASNDEKYINVVYIWRKFVSFYGYVHWRMTTEISVMYGSEKVKHKHDTNSNQVHSPSKHYKLIQCCFNVRPTSETAGQHYNNSESMSRGLWSNKAEYEDPMLIWGWAIVATLTLNLHWVNVGSSGNAINAE